MAKPKRSNTTKATATTTAVPGALAKRAKAAHAARMARLAKQGLDAIAEIRAARAAVATNYFSMGEALAVLQRDGMPEALGRASFEDVCLQDLDMALGTATQLIGLVARMSRATLELLGRDRANAMLALVDATPAEDTVEQILGTTLTLPSGKKLTVADASTAGIYLAAKAFRDARPVPAGKRSMGLTTTPEERSRFAKASKHWQRRDLTSLVETTLVASHEKHGARVRVEMPLSIWELLRPPPRN